MATFSASDIAFTGFRFAREHPGVIAAWAVLQILFSGVLVVALVTMGGSALMELQASPSNPQAELALLAKLMPLYGVMLAAMVVIWSVQMGMMNRAVLRPSDSAFAYIRLGKDELRQGLLLLLSILVFFAAEIAVLIPFIAGLAFIAMKGGRSMDWLIQLGPLVILLGLMFALVRLSLASAVTFETGKVTLFGAWRLTRGHFWKMFGCYLLAWALGMVVLLAVTLIGLALGAVVSGGGMAAVTGYFKRDMSSLAAYLTPMQLVMFAVSAFASALIGPVVMMPAPEIYKRLKG